MNTEQERAEFEARVKAEQGLDLTRLPHGGYRSFATHQAWWAWQARAALQSQVKNDRTLFCDLKTDEEKSAFFLSGRGYETGVIAYSIQNDVAMAYQRCAEYRKELEALQAENERLHCIIRDLKDWDCDVRGGFLSIPVDLRRRMQKAVDRARRIEGERE